MVARQSMGRPCEQQLTQTVLRPSPWFCWQHLQSNIDEQTREQPCGTISRHQLLSTSAGALLLLLLHGTHQWACSVYEHATYNPISNTTRAHVCKLLAQSHNKSPIQAANCYPTVAPQGQLQFQHHFQAQLPHLCSCSCRSHPALPAVHS